MKYKKHKPQHTPHGNPLVKGGDLNPTHWFADVIDLHIDDLTLHNGMKDNKYAVEYQIEAAERAIDDAVCMDKVEVRFIHGIGKGKLQADLHLMLRSHPCVKSFDHSYHAQYGWGSTLVHFK